jgi:hypothetical protein
VSQKRTRTELSSFMKNFIFNFENKGKLRRRVLQSNKKLK